MAVVNPDGINTGNPLETTTAPFTPDRLHEMYWKEGLSFHQIAARFGVSAKSVRRWAGLVGIDSRSTSEAAKLRIKQIPGLPLAFSVRLKETHHAGKLNHPRKGFTKQAAAKGRRKNLEKRMQARVAKPCCYPGCKIVVWRRPSKAKGFVFCGRSHASLYARQQEREEANTAAMKARAEAMLGRTI